MGAEVVGLGRWLLGLLMRIRALLNPGACLCCHITPPCPNPPLTSPPHPCLPLPPLPAEPAARRGPLQAHDCHRHHHGQVHLAGILQARQGRGRGRGGRGRQGACMGGAVVDSVGRWGAAEGPRARAGAGVKADRAQGQLLGALGVERPPGVCVLLLTFFLPCPSFFPACLPVGG